MSSATFPLVIVGLGLASAIGLGILGTSKNLESACATASVIVPGTKDVELAERSYVLTYRETRSGGRGGIDPPLALTIEVEGPAKADVNRSLDATTSSVGSVNIRGLGSVDVHTAGRYTLKVATPQPRGEVCLGYQAVSDASLFMRSAGAFMLAVFVAVIVGTRGKKPRSEPAA